MEEPGRHGRSFSRVCSIGAVSKLEASWDSLQHLF